MKKLYRMAIRNRRTGERDTYVSERQGAAPTGWTSTGICGSFEVPDGEHYDFYWQARRFANKPAT